MPPAVRRSALSPGEPWDESERNTSSLPLALWEIGLIPRSRVNPMLERPTVKKPPERSVRTLPLGRSLSGVHHPFDPTSRPMTRPLIRVPELENAIDRVVESYDTIEEINNLESAA